MRTILTFSVAAALAGTVAGMVLSNATGVPPGPGIVLSVFLLFVSVFFLQKLRVRRLPALVLLILYVSAALALGTMPHDHHDDDHHGCDHHHDCPACMWQVNSTTDVPVTYTPVCVEMVVVPLPSVVDIAPPPRFIISSPSRAPPVSPA
jgi:hypothetical protein